MSLAFSSVSFTNSVFAALLAAIVFLLSYIHPYKNKVHHQLDIFFFSYMLVFLSSMWILQDNSTNLVESSDRVILALLAPIPIMYPLVFSFQFSVDTSLYLFIDISSPCSVMT